jgi:hypothetical protein
MPTIYIGVYASRSRWPLERGSWTHARPGHRRLELGYIEYKPQGLFWCTAHYNFAWVVFLPGFHWELSIVNVSIMFSLCQILTVL